MAKRKATKDKPAKPSGRRVGVRAPKGEGEDAKPNAGRVRAPDIVVFGVLTTSVILAAIRDGATQTMAAGMAGVAARTVRKWLDQGRQNCDDLDRFGVGNWPDGKPAPTLDAYGAFARDYTIARVEVQLEAVRAWRRKINSEDPDAWKAAAKWLAVNSPAEWSEVVNLRQVDLDQDGAVTTVDSDASQILGKLDAQARTLEAIRAAAGGVPGVRGS